MAVEKASIKFIVTWTDTETGISTAEPQPKHIEAIAAALKKCQEEEEKERAVKIKAQE